MRIITPPLIVEENDAFQNDVLDRKSYGETLRNLVTHSSDELVISLDGKWGEGKTTFVKMWRGLLSEENVHSIYIDAFANDYTDDAFISVASMITEYAETHVNKENSEKIAELKEKTKQVGVQLLSWSAKIGIKAATLGAIKDSDIEELKNIKGDIATGLSGLVNDFIGDKIDSYSKDVELIASFRTLLSELPSKLTNNESKPLVIIIDELDRCRPTFVVELLEKIKHLFSVKNVVFILVMHKAQLEESVRCVYGQNIDAHTYLQKFINIETSIPKKTGERHSNDSSKYVRKLLELHELETWSDDRNIIECIEPLAEHFNLSLRQLEKVFTNLAVLYASSREKYLRIVPIIVFLSVIKVIEPELFEKLKYRRSSFDETCNQLKLVGLDEEIENEKNLYRLIQWVRFALLTEQEFDEIAEGDRIKNFGHGIWEYNLSREDLIPFFAKNLSVFIVN